MSTEVDENLKLYQAKQAEIQQLFGSKQLLLSQFNENSLVKGELDLLDEDNSVLKLVGPLLVNVDLEEAKANVDKRLELIEGEIKKIEDQIGSKQGEQTSLGDKIAELQNKMQADALAAVQQISNEGRS